MNERIQQYEREKCINWYVIHILFKLLKKNIPMGEKKINKLGSWEQMATVTN